MSCVDKWASGGAYGHLLESGGAGLLFFIGLYPARGGVLVGMRSGYIPGGAYPIWQVLTKQESAGLLENKVEYTR